MNSGVQVLWNVTLCCWGGLNISNKQSVLMFQGSRVHPATQCQSHPKDLLFSYRHVNSSHILLTMTYTKTHQFQLLISTYGQ
jgi:hypothetical protein